jgi:hypothetical protein
MSKGAKDKTVSSRQSTESAAGFGLAAEATRAAARMQRDATLGAAEITRAGVIVAAKFSLAGVVVAAALGCVVAVANPVATYLKDQHAVAKTVRRDGPALDVIEITVPKSLLESGGTSGLPDAWQMEGALENVGRQMQQSNCITPRTSTEPGLCDLGPERRPTARLEIRVK